jgi:hypothetical protein
MATHKIGYFVGSLAKGSINRTLSKARIRLAPEELEFTEIPIGTCRSTVTTSTPTSRPRGGR